jgi:glycosyltransferase involved in cell wall biosynthesis
MKYYEKFDNSNVDWNDPKIMENHGEWDGNVRRIQEIMSTEDMVKLYHYHDVLVYPSEGEGFGLIPLQALATGMPVICTGRWPSYIKYLNGNVIDTTLGKSKFLNYFDGDICVPSVESTKDHMQLVARNINRESNRFMQQVGQVTHEYSWFNKTEPVIQALYKRLKPGYLT